MFTLVRFKYLTLRIFQFSPKKNLLKLLFTNIHQKNYSNSMTGLDISLFDSVDVQKYLNFLENKCSRNNFQSDEAKRIIALLQEKKEIEIEMESLKNMFSESDKELEKLIILEKQQYLESVQGIKKQILDCILQISEENDFRNVELEIIPGIGGEEAKLFSKELYQMYINYAEYKNWECSGHDNYFKINGNFVFGHLKHEAGVHRVQRVPETEKTGRIHTSTCSVIVLPQPKPNEIKILNKDLIIETMKSSGPGGQNVNKRDTCVRIKHMPSGIVIENQTSRYQYENLKEAILRLKAVLFNMDQQKLFAEKHSRKKEQAGTNDYADKIRTYHYPQNRVTDHRLHFTTQNLKGFLSGNKELDYVINQMQIISRKKQFLSYINNILESVEFKNYEKQKNG